MPIKSKRGREHRYSRMERDILAIFKSAGKGVRFSTLDIVGKVYRGREAPLRSRQSIVSIMGLLIAKVDHNRETFRIGRTKGMGPQPHDFWLEHR